MKCALFSFCQDNNHKLTLTMSPDESYEDDKTKREEERLQKLVSQLSDSDKQSIYQTGWLVMVGRL